MPSLGNVTEARRPKWPKNPRYREQLRKVCRRLELQKKDLSALSKWSVGQIKRALAGEHISFEAHEDILKALNVKLADRNESTLQLEYPWPTDAPCPQALRAAEEKIQGFIRTNLYDDAVQLAEAMFKSCHRAKHFVAAAHWADHAAGVYSLQGKLRDALRLLDDCFGAMKKATASERTSVEMRIVSLRAHFERAMTREYKALGEFRKALELFKSFNSDVDALNKIGVPEAYRDMVASRKIHHKRQQAEMLRLLGFYRAAYQLMDEAVKEYPDWADEARRQGELHKADSLRLLGDAAAALEIYENLERTAKNRHLDGLLGSVLWPKVGALQTAEKSSEQRRKLRTALNDLKTLASTDGNQYGYLVIYAKLVSVSSEIANPDVANKLVSDAMAAGPIEPDCFRTEYAHALLCRGEIERAQKNTIQAKQRYEEALRYYELMEMRWGIVRSTIGLNLVGECRGLPDRLEIEGLDAALWSRLLARDDFLAGTLCKNIP